MPGVVAGARGSNQRGIRAYNERLVLTLIRQAGPLAKASIARLTGLSAQTVSVIMRALEADGLLEKGEPLRGRVGQPSVPMNLVRDGAFFLGLKVGRRSLDMVLCDFRGGVKGRRHLTHPYPAPDHVVAFAHSAATQLVDCLPSGHRDRVAGMGIAIPFRLWDWARALHVDPAEMIAWRDRDIAKELSGSWDFPVYLRNDASAACGAELVFGDQDKPADFLYFFIGFFAGGGVVMDNALVTGRTGNAGALGSLPVRLADGAIAQLVDVASLSRLERAMIGAGHEAASIWDDPHDWAIPPEILDPWLEEAAEGLAQAIFASCCVMDFGDVFIDGWMPVNLRRQLVERTAARLVNAGWAGIELPMVREGTIGSNARELGAASIPLSDHFLVDRNTFLKA